MRLLTVEQARQYSRADPEDTEIAFLLAEAAEDMAESFLNRRLFKTDGEMAQAILDGKAGEDPMVCNAQVLAGILRILVRLDCVREDLPQPESGGFVPTEAQAILWPYRVGLGV